MRQPGVFHLLPQEDHADREENAKAKQAGYQIQFQLLHGEVLIPTAANRQAVVSWQHLGILKGNGELPPITAARWRGQRTDGGCTRAEARA